MFCGVASGKGDRIPPVSDDAEGVPMDPGVIALVAVVTVLLTPFDGVIMTSASSSSKLFTSLPYRLSGRE